MHINMCNMHEKRAVALPALCSFQIGVLCSSVACVCARPCCSWVNTCAQKQSTEVLKTHSRTTLHVQMSFEPSFWSTQYLGPLMMVGTLGEGCYCY